MEIQWTENERESQNDQKYAGVEAVQLKMINLWLVSDVYLVILSACVVI